MKLNNLRKFAPLLVVLLVAIAGAAALFREPSAPYMPPNMVTPVKPGSGKVDQSSCEQSGGYWNECGSACRGAAPGTACIQVCVPYCECAGVKQCPSGSTCGEYVKGTGVCK